MIEEVDGECPMCDGKATIFLSPDDNGRGHVYCEESDCGWVFRNISNVMRHSNE